MADLNIINFCEETKTNSLDTGYFSLNIPKSKSILDEKTGEIHSLNNNFPVLYLLYKEHFKTENSPIAIGTVQHSASDTGEAYICLIEDKLGMAYKMPTNDVFCKLFSTDEEEVTILHSENETELLPVLFPLLYVCTENDSNLAKAITNFNDGLSKATHEQNEDLFIDTLDNNIYIISEFFKNFIESLNSTNIRGDKDLLKIQALSKAEVDSIKANIKPLYGDFSKIENFSISKLMEEVDLSTLKFHKPMEDMSQEEINLIPVIPPTHHVGNDEIFIETQIKNSFEFEEENFKIHNILLEGEAGSGKSQLARVLAAKMHRPYVSFSCSENTDESDIKGLLLPSVDEEEIKTYLTPKEHEIYKILEKEDYTYEKIGEILGLPSLDLIEIAPEKAISMMGEKSDENATSLDAMNIFYNKIFSKIKIITSKVTSASNGVSYKYIDSPIMKAIKNGWFLELQEVTLVRQQSIFSSLFDVLERSSIGIINTTLGSVKKHPDFFCCITTNSSYYGCKPLNQAFRSRFQLCMKLNDPAPDEIKERIISNCGLTDPQKLNIAIDIYKTIKTTIKEEDLNGEIALRNLFQFCRALKDLDLQNTNSLVNLIKTYLIYAVTTDEEDVDMLYNNISAYIGLNI